MGVEHALNSPPCEPSPTGVGSHISLDSGHALLVQRLRLSIAQARFAQHLGAVLAQTRGWFLHRQTRGARKAHRNTDFAQMAFAGMLHILQHANRQQMRVL